MLGLGVENLALAKFLLTKGKFDITVCDYRTKKELGIRNKELGHDVNWQLGKSFKKDLYKFDVLLRSPGWPLWCEHIRESLRINKKIILTSPIRLFFDWCPGKIIGVTGTKGKGTTSSIIYQMLKSRGSVYLGGNIGIAPFDFFQKLNKKSLVILELSSFQLEDLHKSPQVAVITNITKEHLLAADPKNPNYHLSLSEYRKAKEKLIKYQSSKDVTIINADDDCCQVLFKKITPSTSSGFSTKKYLFSAKKSLASGCFVKDNKIILKIKGKKQILGETDKIKLRGRHNLANICAASIASYLMGAKIDSIKKVIKNYKGFEHRLELVKEVRGVKYYNDSAATTPEAAITAIKSFEEPVVLILGGADKGVGFEKLAREVVKNKVKSVILIGETGEKIGKAIKKTLRLSPPRRRALGVETVAQGLRKKKYASITKIKGKDNKVLIKVVKEAKKQADPGDVVVFSPACASFDLFKNYKDRGEKFKREVAQ